MLQLPKILPFDVYEAAGNPYFLGPGRKGFWAPICHGFLQVFTDVCGAFPWVLGVEPCPYGTHSPGALGHLQGLSGDLERLLLQGHFLCPLMARRRQSGSLLPHTSAAFLAALSHERLPSCPLFFLFRGSSHSSAFTHHPYPCLSLSELPCSSRVSLSCP